MFAYSPKDAKIKGRNFNLTHKKSPASTGSEMNCEFF